MKTLALVLLALFLFGCPGPGSSAPSTQDPALSSAQAEVQLRAALDSAGLTLTPPDFTLALVRDDGLSFEYRRGASTLDTSYESASTSKWVTAVILLRQVEKKRLALADHPQTWLTDWPIPSTDALYSITLADLLSFTSGLTVEPLGIDTKAGDFFTVVKAIGTKNLGGTTAPGTEFYYASTHLQVAGAMAIRAAQAAGVSGVSTWQDLFAEFQSETGLFPTSTYDLPSDTNPRLAGGMHWKGREYLAFLKALRAGQLLGPELMAEVLKDRTAGLVVGFSPALEGLGEDWDYGAGSWHEVRPPATQPVAGDRISSPGTYGAYPFWDRATGLVGLVARQGARESGFEGVNLERAVRSSIEAWTAAPVSP